MKKLIIPMIILLSFSAVYSAIMCQTCPEGWIPLSIDVGCQSSYGGEIIPCPNSEWLSEMKTMYSNYIDSGIFFPIAMVIFGPIIIGGLSGLTIGRKGQVSIFLLELMLGVLMFLIFPYLSKILVGVMT